MFRRFFSSCKKLPYNKPWVVSEDGMIKCEPLTKESFDAALKVMRKSFLVNEPLCKAVGLLDEPGAAEELLQTCYDAAKDGVSIVASDTSTNEVVGVIFNKIQVATPNGESYYEKLRKNCKHKSLKAFYDFSFEMETKADVFKRYKTNCLLELMYIATLPDFKQRNIATLLGLSIDKMGRQLYKGENIKIQIDEEEITKVDAVPSVLFGLATSVYSQKIVMELGYDNILEVSYDDYTFIGKTFSERIGGVHKTCRAVVKTLDSKIY